MANKLSEQNNDEIENIDSVNEQNKEDVVAYETYQRVLAQRKSDKEAKEEAIRRAEEAENRLKQIEEEEMKERNQYKELYEKELNEKKELSERLSHKEKLINDSLKISAFKSMLPGKIINDKYLSFVDLNGIIIENGQVLPETVKMAVDKFMSEHSTLIQHEEQDLPGVSARDQQVSGLTFEQWKQLPLAEQRNRISEMRETEKKLGNL